MVCICKKCGMGVKGLTCTKCNKELVTSNFPSQIVYVNDDIL